MKELESESEILDAVFSSPPYLNNAEKYNSDPKDLCNMNQDQYEDKIDVLFKNISRLIKRSVLREPYLQTNHLYLRYYQGWSNGSWIGTCLQTTARKHNLFIGTRCSLN